MGVLRLLTRPSIMGNYVLSGAEAWDVVSRLFDDDRFALVEEPSSLNDFWREICNSLPAGMMAETDAHLAAFALAGDFRLVTLDKGFSRFSGLELLVLGQIAR